jgi:monovalent cation:H+ antiporter-2, CPA2 family
MAEETNHQPAMPTGPHVIIAGFGIPGRFVAELLDYRSIPYVVIEANEETSKRCSTAAFVIGDCREEGTLRRAGIEDATLFAITVPDEKTVHEAIGTAHRMKPDLPIVARVHYTSGGLKAQQLGAEKVIVAEQVVAREFFRVMEAQLTASQPPLPAR